VPVSAFCVTSSQHIAPATGLGSSLARAAQGAVEALLERSSVRYEDINAGGGVVALGWNTWQWQPLPDDAQPLVGAARRAHEKLSAFATIIFQAGAPDRAKAVDELSRWLLKLIEQLNGSHPNGAPASSITDIAARLAATSMSSSRWRHVYRRRTARTSGCL
jgi:hypothetical protein